MKKISVIIPSYNSEKTINKCVFSVIQTGYSPLEIIVVDDASTDNSLQLIAALSKKYPQIIRLVRHKANSGPATARNTGARYAKGDYLFFLDADTEMLLDTLNNFALRIECCDAVVGIYHFESLNSGVVQSYKALLNYYFFSRKGVIEYEVFDAARAGIKKKVFSNLGGFNENLKWGMDYENEEFGYRLCEGYKILLDPAVVVKHTFPGFKKLTKTYLARVALWMEVFMHRKKFESGGVTSAETGISSGALLLALTLSLAIPINSYIVVLCILLFIVYLYGYRGFFGFVLKVKPLILPVTILLNIYFTIIISLGALQGFIKWLFSKLVGDNEGDG